MSFMNYDEKTNKLSLRYNLNWFLWPHVLRFKIIQKHLATNYFDAVTDGCVIIILFWGIFLNCSFLSTHPLKIYVHQWLIILGISYYWKKPTVNVTNNFEGLSKSSQFMMLFNEKTTCYLSILMGNHLINTIEINLYIWAFEIDMLIQQVIFCDICSRLPITIHIFHVKFYIIVYNILRVKMHYWLIYSLCHLVNILSNAKRPWIFQWTFMASIFDIFQIDAIQNSLLIFWNLVPSSK